MLDKKYPTQALVDSLLICLLSLSYAGISSGVFFGIRTVDILIVLGLIYKSRIKIDRYLWILVGLWFASISVSTLVGLLSKTPYLASDLRFFLVFGLGVLLAYSMSKNIQVKVEYIYYTLIVGTILIYVLIPLFPALRFYFIPESFQQEEHLNTVFGPTTILISYLFIFLVFKDRNRNLLFYLSYLASALLIFNLRISRQDLVIMLLLLFWALGYRFIYSIKIRYILIVGGLMLAGMAYILKTQDNRVLGILHPTEDTSFNYRVISNADFKEMFKEEPVLNKAFGLGMGSTFIFHHNEYLGKRELNILDNTPLTILMKSGYLGLGVYLLILLYPMFYLSWHQRLVLFFPIVLSMFLFNHALYNVLYIFGLYYVAFRLREERKQSSKLHLT